jgi:Zn-dependent peptidase ImmA (M78 family)/transcriptional regulator with XRE-family HTH domain
MPTVNPEILLWARRTAGLTPEQAAKSLGLSDARGVSPTERLRQLEIGEAGPSRPLLLKMAKTYHRPLVVFYMSKPPRKGSRGQDFRTLPADYSATDDALIDALIRNLIARQSMIKALLEDEEDTKVLEFVGSARTRDGVSHLVRAIEKVVGIDYQAFYRQPSTDRAFALLRAKVEAIGVFVLLAGDLGSSHTKISLEIFRGFALSDNIVPFVVINDHDSHAAWSFTLLHELTHIWLGQTGISGSRADKGEEVFCNEVASEFLLPEGEVAALQVNKETPLEETEELITQFAKARNLSSSMVAYKLYRRGAIEASTWWALSEFFRERWLHGREERNAAAQEQEGGPSYYQVRRHRIGLNLIRLIDRMMANGTLTTSKAGRLLGVKPKNVRHLIDATR